MSHANPQDSSHGYRLGFLVGAGVYSSIDPHDSQVADLQFGAAMMSRPRLVSFGPPSSPLRQEPPVRVNTPLDERYLEDTHKNLTLVDGISEVSFQSPNSTQIGFHGFLLILIATQFSEMVQWHHKVTSPGELTHERKSITTNPSHATGPLLIKLFYTPGVSRHRS